MPGLAMIGNIWRNILDWIGNPRGYDGPDLGGDVSVLIIISNRKIREYCREAKALSTVSQLPDSTTDKLINNEIAWMRSIRRFIIVLGAMYGLGIWFLSILKPRAPDKIYTEWSVWVLLITASIIFYAWSSRKHSHEEAIWRLFYVLRLLETNPQYWDSAKLKNSVTRQLEYAAKAIERIPLRYIKLAPSVRRDMLMISRRKAQAVRNLQRWVITPGPFSFTDLLERLAADLQLMLNCQWYNLPEADYVQQRSRWLMGVQLAAAIVLFAGAITVIALASKIGSISTVVATLLIAVASGIFTRVGLPLAVIEGSVTAGSKIMSRQ